MGHPVLRLVNGHPAPEDPDHPKAAGTSALPAGTEGPCGPAVSGELPMAADETLCQEAACGDTKAFEALYRRHVPFAYGLAVRLQGGDLDAEDIVHDAFLKAHAGLADLRDGERFRAWLGSIVVSCVRGRLRRKRLLRKLGIGGFRTTEAQAVCCDRASPEVKAQLAQVYRLLAGVPADAQIAWTLRKVQRHSLAEVAELVGCSLATVKRRIAQAQTVVDAKFIDLPGAAESPQRGTPSEPVGGHSANGDHAARASGANNV